MRGTLGDESISHMRVVTIANPCQLLLGGVGLCPGRWYQFGTRTRLLVSSHDRQTRPECQAAAGSTRSGSPAAAW